MNQLGRLKLSRSSQTTPTQNTLTIETREQLQRSSKTREVEEEKIVMRSPARNQPIKSCSLFLDSSSEEESESDDEIELQFIEESPPAKKPYHQPPIKKYVTENPSTPKPSNNVVQQSPLPKPSNESSTSKITETPSPEIRLQHDCKWWYKMIKNNPFFDVILVAADNVEIQSHRVLLAKYSPVFANIFKNSKEIPVRIQMKDFDAETIRAALDFMLDKFDSMKGKELSLLKFAAKYNVTDLMNVCCSAVEKSVDGSNVCEIVQIAYSNNFEDLKKKCLKVLVENKDAVKFEDLPKCILIDVIRFSK